MPIKVLHAVDKEKALMAAGINIHGLKSVFNNDETQITRDIDHVKREDLTREDVLYQIRAFTTSDKTIGFQSRNIYRLFTDQELVWIIRILLTAGYCVGCNFDSLFIEIPCVRGNIFYASPLVEPEFTKMGLEVQPMFA